MTPSSTTTPISDLKFIYFDLDDTLIDHKNAQKRAIQDVWTLYPSFQNVDPGILSSVFSDVNDRLWKAYLNKEIDRLGLKRRRVEETCGELDLVLEDWKEIDAIYRDCYRRHWCWVDDAREAFMLLAKQYDVGVMTNGFTSVQKEKFEYFSFHRYTRHLIISEEVGYLKPDPRIFEYAANRAGYDSGRILYVGDSYTTDILGGAESGWKTAWFARGGEQNNQTAADFTFKHFSELVKALNQSQDT